LTQTKKTDQRSRRNVVLDLSRRSHPAEAVHGNDLAHNPSFGFVDFVDGSFFIAINQHSGVPVHTHNFDGLRSLFRRPGINMRKQPATVEHYLIVGAFPQLALAPQIYPTVYIDSI